MGCAPSISPEALRARLGTRQWPVIVDVRRANAFEIAEHVLPTARWHSHRDVAIWSERYRAAPSVVAYCAHGEQLSQGVAAALRADGVNAAYLTGGISAWRQLGGATVSRERLSGVRRDRPSRWVTAAGPSPGDLACPWLIRRFIDPDAVFAVIAPAMVTGTAQELGTHAFSLLEPAQSRNAGHDGFAAAVQHFAISDPAIERLAALLQGGNPDAAGKPADTVGLDAIARGLALAAGSERDVFEGALWVFDALYRWLCADAMAAGKPEAGASTGL